jgi:hypothetical protein
MRAILVLLAALAAGLALPARAAVPRTLVLEFFGAVW